MKLISRTEELILLAVLRLQEDAYCVPIFDYLNSVTGKKWTLGTIYGPLYRLEQNGYLASSLGSPSAERGGKSKRFYKVTPKGLQALQEIRRLQDLSWDGLTGLVVDET
jgi:PadR family transcriptional regulator PadR